VRVTLAQLEAFYWTVQLGSAQRAANHLCLAQPTLSLRLKDLSAALGVGVLARTGGTLQVTPEGRELLPRVTAIMAELRGLSGSGPERDLAGPVRVGLAEGFAFTCLPLLVAALRDQHPAMEPEWVVSTSTTLEATLLRDALDVAVLLNPIGDERLRLTPLGEQPTVWAAPTSWSLTATVGPQDLWGLPVISNPPPSAMHRQIMGWFATKGLEPKRLNSCTSVAVIAELVAGEIGAGLLPLAMTVRHVQAGQMSVIKTSPTVENGRLFIGRRAGFEDLKATAVTRVITRTLHTMDYLAR